MPFGNIIHYILGQTRILVRDLVDENQTSLSPSIQLTGDWDKVVPRLKKFEEH